MSQIAVFFKVQVGDHRLAFLKSSLTQPNFSVQDLRLIPHKRKDYAVNIAASLAEKRVLVPLAK